MTPLSGAATAVATTARLAASDHGAAQGIAEFVTGFSLEATRPTADEIDALATIAPAGTRVYLSAVPTRRTDEGIKDERIEYARRLKARGFEPVPHVAVRMFATSAALDDFLARMTGEADVRRLLVVAGDREQPAGEFRSAIELIDGGLLQRRGIVEVGIAGYPEGHPRIAPLDLERALADKIAAAETTGIAVHIVTQFCFDPGAIVQWIRRLRDFGLEHPVRVGLAGPTSLATLLRYAQRCGVRASAQGLARQSGLLRQLFAMSAPDGLVRELAQARGEGYLGAVKPHFFSFGGLSRTARWAAAAADGRISLDGGAGFRVEPVTPMS
jgi:methylenetetrahydrofolate reductase (NADPH)